MLSPHIYAAFAQERHQAFLAQAETDRRNRQARLLGNVQADLVRREPARCGTR
jgi:hypothetical protein